MKHMSLPNARATPLVCVLLIFVLKLSPVNFAGAAVQVKMTCNSGHNESWASSYNVGSGRWSMPYVNILLIVYTFMAGLHFDQLKVGIVFIFCLS